MKATLEISMYPLLVEEEKSNYKVLVKEFLKKIKKKKKLKIETNGLSSIVYGEYNDIINLFDNEVKNELSERACLFVFKLGKGTLKYLA